jgi:hypothetical protein
LSSRCGAEGQTLPEVFWIVTGGPDGLQIIWFHSTNKKILLHHGGSRAPLLPLFVLLVTLFLKETQVASAFQFFDSNNHLHRDLRYHPEQPLRISSCVEALDKFRRENPSHLLELIDVTTGHQLIEGASHQPFTEEELMLETMLTGAHSRSRHAIGRTLSKSREQRIQDGKPADTWEILMLIPT